VRFLTIVETSERLGVHHRTIRNWIKQGTIPFVKIGRNYRIDPNVLKRWLDERRVDAGGAKK